MAAPSRFSVLRGKNEELSRTQDAIANTLTPVATAVNNTPIGGAAAPMWVLPDALLADFLATAGQAVPAYHQDALRYVHGKGSVTTAAGQAAGTTIYVLPMGSRPKETQRIPVRGDAGAVQSLVITPAGLVTNDLVIAAGGTIDLVFSFLGEQ